MIKRGGTGEAMPGRCRRHGGSLPEFQDTGFASDGGTSLTCLSPLGSECYLPFPFIVA